MTSNEREEAVQWIECNCKVSDVCPNGRIGMMQRCRIRASAAPQEPPQGWVMVPREPQPKMMRTILQSLYDASGADFDATEPEAYAVYRAIVAAALQPQASPQAPSQEPVAELQHCRDGVWVHLHCGGEHVSINLSADEFTRKFALEYAKHQSQDAVLHPLYASPVVAAPQEPVAEVIIGGNGHIGILPLGPLEHEQPLYAAPRPRIKDLIAEERQRRTGKDKS